MRATVLWTGGKDSALALYKAQESGYKIVNLLTFVPRDASFLAHPLPLMKCQAEAMGVPHYEAVVSAPIEGAYEEAIRSFKKYHKIDVLITGDIAEIDGYPNWIRQRSANSGIEVVMPLWGADRARAFSEFISRGFRAIISCVKKDRLTQEWLGRELDGNMLDELRSLQISTGLDICGENGEYHTLTVDGPIFKKSVVVSGYSKHENKTLSYIKPYGLSLKNKD